MNLVFFLLAGLVSYLMTIHLPWVATVPILVFIFVFCITAKSKTSPFSIAVVIIGTCIGIYMLHPNLRKMVVRLLTP